MQTGAPPPSPEPLLEWVKTNVFSLIALVFSVISLWISLGKNKREMLIFEQQQADRKKLEQAEEAERKRAASGSLELKADFQHEVGDQCFIRVTAENSRTTGDL